MIKVLSVFGTRPEAIKMAPLCAALEADRAFESKICISSQHRQMLDQMVAVFDLQLDFDLDLMRPGQDLTAITTAVLQGMGSVFDQFKPDMVLVHGDTTTTLSASLAAYYHRIPVAHIEAGLRTGDRYNPWPEEANRRLTSALATLHFAPTNSARQNLLAEGILETTIYMTGNTVIDALLQTVERIEQNAELRQSCLKQLKPLNFEREILLVTGHRREHFGSGLNAICEALLQVADNFADMDIVYPVHLNPQVQVPVKRLLGGIDNIHLLPPLDYLTFVYLMSRSYLVLTDSGGIQEEAPSLGKPVLVMREVTERPEAIAAGTAKLVGTDIERILSNVTTLVTDKDSYQRMVNRDNPYGDGNACQRIIRELAKLEVGSNSLMQ